MITVDASALNRAVEMLQGMPKKIDKAQKAAIKKTITGIRRYAAQKVKEDYLIKGKYVTRTLSTRFYENRGELWSRGGVNDLRYFKTRPTGIPKRRPKKGIFAQVRRDSGGGYLPHAFMVGMQSGHVGVFERTSRRAYPIEKRSGPSTPGMLSNPKVSGAIQKRMEERLEINVDHEIRAVLAGYRR